MSATMSAEAHTASEADNEHAQSHSSTASPMGLTVTFQDVSVEVHGQGEDYGSTCLSVVKDMFPAFGSEARPTRVCILANSPNKTPHCIKYINYVLSISFKISQVKLDQEKP